MKENTREISVLKQRILQYLDSKGVSKYECYKHTGITNGVLSQVNGMSEDNILRFLSYYNDISSEWLLTGKGSMLRDNKRGESSVVGCSPNATPISPTDESFIYKMYKEEKVEKESKVEELTAKMLQMAEEIGNLKAKLSQYEPEAEVSNEKAKGLGHAKTVSTKKPSSPNADNATSAAVQ